MCASGGQLILENGVIDGAVTIATFWHLVGLVATVFSQNNIAVTKGFYGGHFQLNHFGLVLYIHFKGICYRLLYYIDVYIQVTLNTGVMTAENLA